MNIEIVITAGTMAIIGSMITIAQLNRNWFKRQDLKMLHKEKMMKMELGHKRSMKKLGMGLTGKKTDILNNPLLGNLLKNLDGEQIGEIIKGLQGEGYEVEEGDDWIGKILKVVPPEVIQKFVGKFIGGKGTDVMYED